MKRIPLEKRLAAAGTVNNCPRAVWFCLESYFLCLSEINRDPAYKSYYKTMLWDKQRDYGDIRSTFVAEAAAKALTGIYPAEKGTELLYQILVKPFCKTEGDEK